MHRALTSAAVALVPLAVRVRCSRDGSVWQAYTVWAGSNDVSGPYPADPALD